VLLSLGIGVACFSGCSGDKAKPGEQRGTETVEPDDPGRTRQETMSQGKAGLSEMKATLLVLSDKRCQSRSCRTEPVVRQLKQAVPDLQVENLDYGSAEGAKLFKEEGLKTLPAFLFTEEIKAGPGYVRLGRHLKQTDKGKLLQLKVRADWDPLAEICDNGVDDTGNGKIDCADPDCRNAPVCRPEEKKRLDLFTMSMCPFGTQALDSMSEVLKAFDNQLDFRIHYIATEQGQGFKALHGQPEVDENIRELCAIKHYPKSFKYMDYIWCRNRMIKDPNWKTCTGPKTGIDAQVIERCATGGEGRGLLRESLKLAETLKVSASPTWLANNRHLFHAIAPEHIKDGLCKHNPGLKGCEKKLSTAAKRPGAVCD
jgi:hypothetical protein